MIRNAQLEGGSFTWKSGPTGVLLIHGFTATTAEVRPLAKVLFSAGYTVSAPLLPGHGTAPEDANQYTWQDWLNTARTALIDLQLQCDPVFLAGESMGAVIALHLASFTPQVRGIALFAPAIKFHSPLVSIMARFFSLYRSVYPKPEGPLTVVDELWQGYPVYPLKAMLELIRVQKHVIGHLPEITQPLLIIQGRKDRSVSPQAPVLIRSHVKSRVVEIAWLEETGHCVILDQERDQAAQLTLSFLRRIESSGG